MKKWANEILLPCAVLELPKPMENTGTRTVELQADLTEEMKPEQQISGRKLNFLFLLMCMCIPSSGS